MEPTKEVLGLVSTPLLAEGVVEALRTNGFATNDISVFFADRTGTRASANDLFATMSRTSSDATRGDINAILMRLGVPEIEAKQYEGKVKRGHILVAVDVEDGNVRDRAKSILERHGATDIVTPGETSPRSLRIFRAFPRASPGISRAGAGSRAVLDMEAKTDDDSGGLPPRERIGRGRSYARFTPDVRSTGSPHFTSVAWSRRARRALPERRKTTHCGDRCGQGASAVAGDSALRSSVRHPVGAGGLRHVEHARAAQEKSCAPSLCDL